MPALQCPFCGAAMNPPIKFCVSCGRHVSSSDANRVGLKLSTGSRQQVEDEERPESKISKKSYSFHRHIRHFFFISSTFLMLALVYFFTMRFVLHQPLPFDKIYKDIQKQAQKQTQPNKPTTPTKKYGAKSSTKKKKKKAAFGTATTSATATE